MKVRRAWTLLSECATCPMLEHRAHNLSRSRGKYVTCWCNIRELCAWESVSRSKHHTAYKWEVQNGAYISKLEYEISGNLGAAKAAATWLVVPLGVASGLPNAEVTSWIWVERVCASNEARCRKCFRWMPSTSSLDCPYTSIHKWAEGQSSSQVACRY